MKFKKKKFVSPSKYNKKEKNIEKKNIDLEHIIL